MHAPGVPGPLAAVVNAAHPQPPRHPATNASRKLNGVAWRRLIAQRRDRLLSAVCRNADLETILATDLNQLGQVPKLQALAISALRSRLLLELEGLITTQQASGGKSITSAYNKAKQVLLPLTLLTLPVPSSADPSLPYSAPSHQSK